MATAVEFEISGQPVRAQQHRVIELPLCHNMHVHVYV
jgi:hypothetical protein